MTGFILGRMFKPSYIVAFALILLAAPQAWAVPVNLSLASPKFIIPVDYKNGTLNIFSNGYTKSGFDVLGSQTFTLGGGYTDNGPGDCRLGTRQGCSMGFLTINLHFTHPIFDDPQFIVNAANVMFTVYDFDLNTDFIDVNKKITLDEMAILQHDNTVIANLDDYLPDPNMQTDDRMIQLDPIDLVPPLADADFINPFILTLKLSATVKNRKTTAVTLKNTPEAVFTQLALNAEVERVPEPTSLLLLGSGISALIVARRRLRTRG